MIMSRIGIVRRTLPRRAIAGRSALATAHTAGPETAPEIEPTLTASRAPAGDSDVVVRVRPRAPKKWASSDSSRSRGSCRSDAASSASTVAFVSSDRSTIRVSVRGSIRARARMLMAALMVWAPGWNR